MGPMGVPSMPMYHSSPAAGAEAPPTACPETLENAAASELPSWMRVGSSSNSFLGGGSTGAGAAGSAIGLDTRSSATRRPVVRRRRGHRVRRRLGERGFRRGRSRLQCLLVADCRRLLGDGLGNGCAASPREAAPDALPPLPWRPSDADRRTAAHGRSARLRARLPSRNSRKRCTRFPRDGTWRRRRRRRGNGRQHRRALVRSHARRRHGVIRNGGAMNVDDVPAFATLHPRRVALRELLVGDAILRLALGAQKLHAAVGLRRRCGGTGRTERGRSQQTEQVLLNRLPRHIVGRNI